MPTAAPAVTGWVPTASCSSSPATGGGSGHVAPTDSRHPGNLLIVGVSAVETSSPGRLDVTEAGVRVTADPDTGQLEIVLSG